MAPLRNLQGRVPIVPITCRYSPCRPVAPCGDDNGFGECDMKVPNILAPCS
jgi:hypothetical protein